MSNITPKNDPGIAAIVLAGGLSERMGRFKPLLPLGAYRTIERVVMMFQAAGLAEVVVVTGHRAGDILEAVVPLNVRCVDNPDYVNGMFSSVLAGIRSLPDWCRAFFIHPADIPLVRPQTVRQLAAAWEKSSAPVLYPTFDGRKGHPTLIRADLVPRILEWPGHGGLRAFLQNYETDSLEFPVIDEAVLLDLDTPGDYSRMLARLINEGLPSAEECRVLLENRTIPSSVAAHCRAVADVARRLAQILNAAGTPVHIELVRTAALLHDIARTETDHAEAGARLLEGQGFTGLAPIVRVHMDLEVKAGRPIDEAQLVYLADKMVDGTRRVDPEQRFARRLEACAGDPRAVAAIERRRQSFRRIRDKVERITGLALDEIIVDA